MADVLKRASSIPPNGEVIEASGGELMIRCLEAAGVKYVFGIPGSNEAGVMDALVDHPDLQFVLGLHEGPITAMGDGYARISGKPSFVMVHAVAGTANGLGQLANAAVDGTPIVFVAGNQDSRLRGRDAFLEWEELTALGQSCAKWTWDVLRADSIPEIMRRAFKIAGTAPRGPVFLTFSKDLWFEEKVKAEMLPQERFAVSSRTGPDRESIERAAQLLLQAKAPLLLAGEDISKYGGRKQLIELAELLAAPVVGDFVAGHGHIDFPTAHPQYFGYFPGQKQFPMAFDVFFSAGGRMFSEYDHASEPIVARDVKTIHMSIDSLRIARTYPVDVPILANPEEALKALLEVVQSQISPARRKENPERLKRIAKFRNEMDAARKKQLKEEWSSEPISTPRLMAELNEAMDPNAIVVAETITSDPIQAAYIDYYKGEPGRMHVVSQGGILGWGIGAACGAKLAAPDREVVLLSGDGSFQFGIQGLWTAARYEIPVLFVILNNRSYQSNRLGLVKRAGRAAETKKYMGSHLGDPEIGHVAIARGYGVEGNRVAKPDEIQPALQQALQTVRGGKPYVLDVLIARRFQDADAAWHEKFSAGRKGNRSKGKS